MRLVHKITSESYYGLSKIMVELDPATGAAEIPQLWDELRRKVLNIQSRLPAGARRYRGDDFGDVYRHLLRPFGRRRIHMVRTARVGAADQDGAGDRGRRAEGDALRRADACGERLCRLAGASANFLDPAPNRS